MDVIRISRLLPMAAALIMAGCLKDDLVSCFVTLAPDWSARTEGIDPPAEWMVCISGCTFPASGNFHTLSAPFTPGTHAAYVYNRAEGTGVNGTAVSVAGAAAGYINNSPGWFFSSAMQLNMAALAGQTVTVGMRQQVRQLTVVIDTGEDDFDLAGVSGITATLSGVAGSFDMATGVHGTPSEVELNFTKTGTVGGADRWSATVRLLGVVPAEEQRFSAVVSFTGTGTPYSATWESDLTLPLAGFNSGKEIPLTLEGIISPHWAEPGFTGTIDAWDVVYNGILIRN